MSDNVNHPAHYTDGKIEVIDYIEDKGLNYHLGNAVKYISRAGKKDPDKYVEDLEKAVWYLQREIDRQKQMQLWLKTATKSPLHIDLRPSLHDTGNHDFWVPAGHMEVVRPLSMSDAVVPGEGDMAPSE